MCSMDENKKQATDGHWQPVAKHTASKFKINIMQQLSVLSLGSMDFHMDIVMSSSLFAPGA